MRSKFEKTIDYPEEITFKSVFRRKAGTLECIKNILNEKSLKGEVTSRISKNEEFISFTITAEFPSDLVLNNVCNQIANLEGYMTMF